MVSKYLLIAAAVCCFFTSSDSQIPPVFDPRVYYSAIEIVCGEGYYIQEYKIETEDGYVLTIHRIPNGEKHPKIPPRRNHYQHVHEGYHPDFEKCVRDSRQQNATGPPVLLSHGLLAASDSWVLQGSNYDLAYLLVEKGYDVWMSNIRGNFYSRQHKTLRPSQPKFWDFSFHENGIYDIPNTIDYILHFTKYPKLTYIGHSMGTTMFFVMVSLRPEYNDKVNLFVGMAPVSQIRQQSFRSNKRTVLSTVMSFLKTYDRIGVYEFLPRTTLSNLLFKTMCTLRSPLQDFCYDAFIAIFGFPSKQLLRKSLPTYLSHAINGVSVKTFLHYNQLLNESIFRAYDHGFEENLRKYGQAEPPVYDLENVKIPSILHYSAGDFISNIEDVAILKTLLPNVIESYEYSNYNHVDFIWAYSCRDTIYPRILQAFDRFVNQSSAKGYENGGDLKSF